MREHFGKRSKIIIIIIINYQTNLANRCANTEESLRIKESLTTMTAPTPSTHPPTHTLPQNCMHTQLPHSTILPHTSTPSPVTSEEASETPTTTLSLLHSYTRHLPPTQTVHPQRGVLPQPSEEAIQLAHRIRELIRSLSSSSS